MATRPVTARRRLDEDRPGPVRRRPGGRGHQPGAGLPGAVSQLGMGRRGLRAACRLPAWHAGRSATCTSCRGRRRHPWCCITPATPAAWNAFWRGARGRCWCSTTSRPPRYFWDIDPAEAVRCELATTQLGDVAHRVAALAGVSAFNARELSGLAGREAGVIPILFDRRAMPAAGPGIASGVAASAPAVLFVGRLVPPQAPGPGDPGVRALSPGARAGRASGAGGYAAIGRIRRGAVRSGDAPGAGRRRVRERAERLRSCGSATGARRRCCACPSTRASASRCSRRFTSGSR